MIQNNYIYYFYNKMAIPPDAIIKAYIPSHKLVSDDCDALEKIGGMTAISNKSWPICKVCMKEMLLVYQMKDPSNELNKFVYQLFVCGFVDKYHMSKPTNEWIFANRFLEDSKDLIKIHSNYAIKCKVISGWKSVDEIDTNLIDQKQKYDAYSGLKFYGMPTEFMFKRHTNFIQVGFDDAIDYDLIPYEKWIIRVSKYNDVLIDYGGELYE